jgi:hypothetical protein
MRQPSVAGIERALYEEHSVVRMLGMRRTMFAVPVELVPVVHASCTQAIAVQQRRLLVQLLEQAGVAPDVPGWLADLEQSVLRALAARGEATAAELGADEPRLRTQVLLAEGKSYQALQSISTRILFVLAAEGHIVRGRPRGSWISGQVQWSPIQSLFADGIPPWPTEAAQVELVRSWLGAFGPATIADLKWWTGWTMGQTRKVLAQLGPVEVDLDGGTGLVLADDVEPTTVAEPWVALLPALDPTVMGWSARDWFLGEHRPALFDRSGNVGPTVWSDGRIVGGWAQRRTGEIVYRLLEDVGTDAVRAIDRAAEELRAWIGEVRVTPRFRTPLERELS